MWLKKLNEIELGIVFIKKQKILETGYSNTWGKPLHSQIKENSVQVSLNDEDSFERFFDLFNKISLEKLKNKEEKEKIINSLKSQMIFENRIDTKVKLQLKQGKIKIIFKK
jgi:hypothetical protein